MIVFKWFENCSVLNLMAKHRTPVHFGYVLKERACLYEGKTQLIINFQ